MQKIFHNILFPVSLDKHTDSWVAAAVDFANRLECNLHLLHLTPASPRFLPWGVRRKKLVEKNQEKNALYALQQKHGQAMRPGYYLMTACCQSNPEQEMTEYALSHQVDLICIHQEAAQPKRFLGDYSRQLSHSFSCPLLVAREDPPFLDFEKIVLPIDQQLPVNRIKVALFLARHLNAAIHLVSMEQQGQSTHQLASLKKAYQLLRDHTELSLVCSTFSGDDLRYSTLQYARDIKSGLVISTAPPVPLMKGLWKKLSAFLPAKDRDVPQMLVD